MPHAVCKDFIKMLKTYVTVELLCVAYFNSLSMMKSMEPYIYGSLSENGAILVLDGFLASAMSEVCFFHV